MVDEVALDEDEALLIRLFFTSFFPFEVMGALKGNEKRKSLQTFHTISDIHESHVFKWTQ